MLGLKNNLLSISTLDAKGMQVAFIDGQVIMWRKGKTIDDAVVIGIRGNLGSKMGLIRKCAKISFCELEFKNQ